MVHQQLMDSATAAAAAAAAQVAGVATHHMMPPEQIVQPDPMGQMNPVVPPGVPMPTVPQHQQQQELLMAQHQQNHAAAAAAVAAAHHAQAVVDAQQAQAHQAHHAAQAQQVQAAQAVADSEAGQKKKNKAPRARVRWTQAEEQALHKGVAKYGAFANCWAKIKQDAELGEDLKNRSNVDLKDKWRNSKNQSSKMSRKPKRLEDLTPEIAESGWTADMGLSFDQYTKLVVDDILKNRVRLLSVIQELRRSAEKIDARPDMMLVNTGLVDELDNVMVKMQQAIQPPSEATMQASLAVAATAAAAAQAMVASSVPPPQHPQVPPPQTSAPAPPTAPVSAAAAAAAAAVAAIPAVPVMPAVAAHAVMAAVEDPNKRKEMEGGVPMDPNALKKQRKANV